MRIGAAICRKRRYIWRLSAGQYRKCSISSPWRIFWKKIVKTLFMSRFDANGKDGIEQMDDNLAFSGKHALIRDVSGRLWG